MNSSLKVLWSKEMTTTLIRLLEASPPLWDVTSADYRNKLKRESYLKKIASEMHLHPKEIKTKILKLRTQYSNEKNKMKKLRCGKKKYVTKWEYFSSLNFLFKFENTNPENADFMEIPTFASELQNPFKGQEELPGAVTQTDFSDAKLESNLHSSKRTRSRKTPRSGDNENSTQLQETEVLNHCMSVIAKKKRLDECSLFGKFVANELRNLKDAPDLASKLKRAIQRSLLNVAEEYAERLVFNSSL